MGKQPWLDDVGAKLQSLGGWGIDFAQYRQEKPQVSAVKDLPGDSTHNWEIPQDSGSNGMSQVKVLDGLFPEDWCKVFTEKHSEIGFTPQTVLTEMSLKSSQFLSAEEVDRFLSYKGKNTSEAITFKSDELAAYLWECVRDHVPQMVQVNNTTVYGEGLGRYRPCGVIPEFRFMRYGSGQAFLPHVDPVRYLESNPATNAEGVYQSCATLAIYLNNADEFEGGSLTFVKRTRRPGASTDDIEPLYSVQPKAGRCAIFLHKEVHEGGIVHHGYKHMMQCDVLYVQV